MDWQEASTPFGVIIQHVGYSIGMLGDLPRFAADEATGLGEAGSACLESFFVHVRVLLDFFMPPAVGTRRPTDRDVTDLSPTWTYPDDERRQRMLKLRQITNQQVAHITAHRFTSEVEETSTVRLVEIARDVFAVADRFCHECTDVSDGKRQFTALFVAEQRLAILVPSS